MSNLFSPGPWSVRARAGLGGHGVNDVTGRSVCAIPSNGTRPYEERDANAALLAAAPDLRLEVIRLLRDAARNAGIDPESPPAWFKLMHASAFDLLNRTGTFKL